MINRLVLDSSIVVEYAKGTRTELLEYLVGQTGTELCINSTVLSEYTYHWLGNQGRKAPRTLQQSRGIPELLSQVDLATSLTQFTVLPSDNRIVPIYLDLMQRYNGNGRPAIAQ